MTHRTRVLFADLLNLPRGKYVPTAMAKGGKIGFARGVFGVTFDRDLIPVPGAGVLDGIPDVDLMLDSGRRLGWQDGTEIALGTLHVDGAPFALCPRAALQRAVDDWSALGLTPNVGLEMEAYVFERDDSGHWVRYDTPGAFVYGTGPQNDPAGLMDDIWETAQLAGLPLESMNGEYDRGQFELTMEFTDAVRACDDAFLFRTMAREVAYERGLLLSFLPKPVPDLGGSGLHVNFSLEDTHGRNVVAPDGALSDIARGCTAGLIAHHEALAALLAVTVNSYERLGPASMAGYWANWAVDHRLVTTRATTHTPISARLEHRMADCAANPYLAVAAVLQAARLGVVGKLELQDAEDMDGLENTRETRHTPDNLAASLDALEADTALQTAVGQEICDAMICLKRDEVTRLSGKDWDAVRAYYMEFV